MLPPLTQAESEMIRAYRPLHVFTDNFYGFKDQIWYRSFLRRAVDAPRPPSIGFNDDRNVVIISLGGGYYRLFPRERVKGIHTHQGVDDRYGLDSYCCLQADVDKVAGAPYGSRSLYEIAKHDPTPEAQEEFQMLRDALMKKL